MPADRVKRLRRAVDLALRQSPELRARVDFRCLVFTVIARRWQWISWDRKIGHDWCRVRSGLFKIGKMGTAKYCL